MKKISILSVLLCLIAFLSACEINPDSSYSSTELPDQTQPAETVDVDGICEISLNGNKILVDGKVVPNDGPVYVARDIICYEEGKDFTYGEGSDEDAHGVEEADEHIVVHITQPGKYQLEGNLSKGQIAVDLGKDAKENSDAVVTLILNGIDITCEVAPAIIFYNVYECSDDDAENATKDVETTMAGANVIIADGTENTINGSYVAKIYKPESVVLSEDGTEVEDASKLHKYDGAFYSKMSMNINGGDEGTGVLNINAENEGLDSELHLTINGGIINIKSGNDGINTNEDYVSVTTINGGELNILVTGATGEGDGIDSNGWLVINGGRVTAEACSFSGDAGIDSDMGIHINGGTVLATGSMLDRIEDGGQKYVVFNLANKQSGAVDLSVKDSDSKIIEEISTTNEYSIIVYSGPELKEETYYLYSEDIELAQSNDGMTSPDGMGRPDMPPGGMVGPGMPPPEDNF